MEKLKIDRPIVCEGKYDKIKLSSVCDAKIIMTDGFGIFKNDEKLALVRALAAKNGVILLTDSDGAGQVIRNYFRSALPKAQVINIYTPEIAGKEKRKKTASKAGYLGVEGISADTLRTLLAPYANDSAAQTRDDVTITKAELFEFGLSGGDNSALRRQKLCAAIGLPRILTPNALLEALNMLYSHDSGIELLKKYSGEADDEQIKR
ncbi:MAG: DUF4093 domain-containing protein [Eubacteriales bacterium]